jgi:GT2 family glycosyltransferase
MPWIRVVIVNYNAGPLLAAAIAGLACQTEPDFEAVIVDNASTDGSAEAVVLPDCRFRLLRAGTNLGFAAGCNLGASGARAAWLAMLNPDAVPAPDWLASMRRATVRHPEAAAFGSTQVDARDSRTLDGAGDNYSIFGVAWRGGAGAPAESIRDDFRVFSPCAAAALYRRDAFEQAGGFSESFFCYLEDVDLGFRLNLRGWDAIQVAGARVTHIGSASSGGKTSAFAFYHALRNAVFVCFRCVPFPLVLLSVPLLVAWQFWVGLRTNSLAARVKALRDGFARVAPLLRERRAIQAERRLSAWQVARLLVWRPHEVTAHAIVPLPQR